MFVALASAAWICMMLSGGMRFGAKHECDLFGSLGLSWLPYLAQLSFFSCSAANFVEQLKGALSKHWGRGSRGCGALLSGTQAQQATCIQWEQAKVAACAHLQIAVGLRGA